MPTVDPALIYQYLLQRGASPTHATGMLASIQGESGFNPLINEIKPLVPGSRGGFGLFQHTGPRRVALEKAYGPAPTWQQQIDFALSEPEGQSYLKTKVATPEDATAAFVRDFERPADIPGAIAKRQSFLPDLHKRIGGVDVRMASATDGLSTDTDRTPSGDPMTGLLQQPSDYSLGNPPPLSSMAASLQALRESQAAPEQPMGLLGTLLLAATGMALGKSSGAGALSGLGLAGNALAADEERRLKGNDSLLKNQLAVEEGLARLESRQALSRFTQSLPPDMRDAALAGHAGAVVTDLLKRRAEALNPEPPMTRSYLEGADQVTQTWTPQGWVETARAPRWQPQGPAPAPSGYSWKPDGTLAPIPGGPAAAASVGSVPAGMVAVPDPTSPSGTRLEPIPGSPVQVERTDRVETLKSAVADIERMKGLMAEHGSTIMLGKPAGEAGQLYSTIVAKIAALRNMGVLQPGELANIENSLLNPTSISSLGTGLDRATGQYDELKRGFTTKLEGLGVKLPDAAPARPSAPPIPAGWEVMP